MLCDRTCKVSAQVVSVSSALSQKMEPNDKVFVALTSCT